MGGYGAETTGNGDRPEIVRHSYIGFEADTGGSGDAGDPATAGSESLFDTEDAFPVGTRHIPVVGMCGSNGRSVLCTSQRAFVLYGTSRDDFQLDLIDNQRGLVATWAIVEADGIVYWMSPLGPCRYAGGRVESLARLIHPRISEINTATMHAEFSPDEHLVMFYYALLSDTNTVPNRVLAFDTHADEWLEDTLGIRVFCSGRIRPSGAETPGAAPTIAAATNITNSSAQGNWVNGDTSPSVTTEVQLDDNNIFSSPSTYNLGSGVALQSFTGLSASTTYYYRVRHIRNGTASAWSSTQSFTTLAPALVATPTGFAVANDPVYDPVKGFLPSVLATWTPGESGCVFELYRSTTNGFTPAPSNLLHTTGADDSSYRDNGVTNGVTYYYVLRAYKGGNYSNYTAQVSVTVSITG
jgi:hypothetical protein